MAYIKKLKYNELVGGTDNTDVYPVTSTEAVYGPDNINQQVVNEDRLRRIELLEKNVQSLDGLKEMVEAFISGDYDSQGGLSDNNFTDELKAKLDGLENYNDAELRQLLADIDTAKANAEDVYTKSEIDDKLGDIQGALTFDNTPTAGSDNPVKSSGIYTALQGKQDTLTFDTTPTANSTNPVTSAGIKAYVDNATPTITMDDTPTSGSSNAVKSSGIYNALQDKQNTLTFDSTPTASSSNPVISGGVKAALDLKANQSTTYTKTEVDALFDDVAYLGDDDGQATTLPFDPQADTVWNKAQTLGSAQQAQARNNIGAVGSVTVNGTTYTPTNGNVDLGTIGGSSGDVNVIETVKVNGTALIPDANKAVDVSVPTNVSDLTNDAGYTTETSVINHGTSDTTFVLTPNVLHIWGTVATLTLTLATPTDATIVNEYMFQFTSGSTATTLSMPSTVVWDNEKGEISIESGYIYQVSILNNIALWARVAV